MCPFFDSHDFTIFQRFNASAEQIKDISEYSEGFLQKLLEERNNLESHVSEVNEINMKTIAEFQKAYEVSYHPMLLHLVYLFLK